MHNLASNNKHSHGEEGSGTEDTSLLQCFAGPFWDTINTGPGTRGPGTQGPEDPRTGDPRTQILEGCVAL